MDADHVSDGMRYVIQGDYKGDALPDRIQNLDRVTHVAAGSNVKGAIFGGKIIFHGAPFFIEKAVFAKKEIAISELTERSAIQSSIYAGDVLLIEGGNHEGWLAVHGDVISDKMNMKNTIVYGNILGKQVYLDNCVVFGLVSADRSLHIENSLIGTFTSYSAEIGNNVKMLHPYAVSHTPVKIGGGRVACTCYSNLEEYIMAEDGEESLNACYEFSQEDIVRDKISRITKYLDGEEAKQKSDDLEGYIISLGARVMNTEDYKEAVKSNGEAIQRLVMNTSLATSERSTIQDIQQLESKLLLAARVPTKQAEGNTG